MHCIKKHNKKYLKKEEEERDRRKELWKDGEIEREREKKRQTDRESWETCSDSLSLSLSVPHHFSISPKVNTGHFLWMTGGGLMNPPPLPPYMHPPPTIYAIMHSHHIYSGTDWNRRWRCSNGLSCRMVNTVRN